MSKFLHVVVLGPFAGNVFRMFEDAAPGRNVFIGFARDDSAAPAGAIRVSSVSEILELVRQGGPWTGLTVNGLSDEEMIELAAGIPPTLGCAWFVWGFEAYSRARGLRTRLLKPLTRAATTVPSQTLKSAVGQWERMLLRDLRDALHPPFNRYDLCVSQLPEEYALFRAKRLFTTSEYHWGAVGCLEDYVDVNTPVGNLGSDIQLGNSASPSQNHLDAMAFIARYAPSASRVVVPLSYGDPAYRGIVLEQGAAVLGARFAPVLEFMPLDAYNTLMQSCGVVIMNQMRQQALGNILSAIWRGALVYLNDTPVYQAMRRLGVDVRLFEDEFPRDSSSGLAPLPRETVERHREILLTHVGRERVVSSARSLLMRLSEPRR